MSCAAALAVLDVIEEQDLLARSNAIGARIQQRLKALAEKHSCIGEVRGLGAMVAMELFHDGDLRRPAADLTKAMVARAHEKGLLLLSCGHNGNVIRILSPLTASDAVVDEGLDIIEEALDELVPAPRVADAVS